MKQYGQNIFNVESKTEIGTVFDSKSCSLQIAKPKLPKFSGDVQEYAIFHADFKHVFKRRYSINERLNHPAPVLKKSHYRKVRSRGLERENKPATLHGLMSWMTILAITFGRQNLGQQISDIGLASVLNQDKIAFVSAFVHSVDLYVVNWFLFLYVCVSCLKRAAREHRQANCSRRKQCTKTESGTQCTQTHHSLLHKNNAVNIGVSSLMEKTKIHASSSPCYYLGAK